LSFMVNGSRLRVNGSWLKYNLNVNLNDDTNYGRHEDFSNKYAQFNLNCEYAGITQYVGYLKYHYV
jgi:hypothetical protein